jgi:hypothetical protein
MIKASRNAPPVTAAALVALVIFLQKKLHPYGLLQFLKWIRRNLFTIGAQIIGGIVG